MKLEVIKARTGDCLYFKGESKSFLIDCGFKMTYAHSIKNLDGKLDFIMLTHVDQDHINGVFPLLDDVPKRFSPSKVYVNTPDAIKARADSNEISIRQAITLSELLKEKSIASQGLIEGDVLDLEQGVSLEVISPNKNTLAQFLAKYAEMEAPSENLQIASKLETRSSIELSQLPDSYPSVNSDLTNASSIAFKLRVYDKLYLFLGDAHPEELVKSLKSLGYSSINKLPIDMIKLSHHGSVKSISMEFISMIICRNFIVSTNGCRGRHPSRELIAKLAHCIERGGDEINFYFNYSVEEIEKSIGPILTEEEKSQHRVKLIYKREFEL